MALISIANLLAATDRIAGRYASLSPVLSTLSAAFNLDVDFYYGGATTSGVSLGDGILINTVGPNVVKAVTKASGNNVPSFLLGALVSSWSSYLTTAGTNNGVPSVTDIASAVRYYNGCTNPTAAGNGSGTSFAYLLQPGYAALVSLLLNGSNPLPPDVVFAPTGYVMGTFHYTSSFVAGPTLMTPVTAPYAPVKATSFQARCGQPIPYAPGYYTGNIPNGTLYVVLTGLNQAGASVTWRGDIGTGISNYGQVTTLGGLVGAAGGANGGTAASTDRLLHITNIALDGARTSTATRGDMDIIVAAERATL